ncbi:SMI1/KNR4 family protein [Streptomyces griseoviridis]|uniref:SMI1/KNR4 family protein n=1 Tax=Streptomyces griseoviridis TaxID=45398 RepID=UPI003433D5D8
MTQLAEGESLMWIDTLKDLMPPHPGSGDIIDWEAVERSWGTRFPEDYKKFIAVYGEGGVDDYLSFLLPEPRTERGTKSSGRGMEAESMNAASFWPAVADADSSGTTRGLVAWGVDSSADILCWRVIGSDPGSWPVVVWNQDDAAWSEFQFGMVEFICRIFRSDLDECPLGGVGLWGNANPRFMHAREHKRLSDDGIEPWTGEADPYSGMFG